MDTVTMATEEGNSKLSCTGEATRKEGKRGETGHIPGRWLTRLERRKQCKLPKTET